MTIDLPTLAAVTAFSTAVSGLMLLFSWLQDRRAATLGLWGGALVLLTVGAVVLPLRGIIPPSWSITFGGAVCVASYGMMWCGARRFEGRCPDYPFAAAGAGLWLFACQFDAFLGSMTTRVELYSALTCCYTLLVASEYWRARDKALMSRWPAIALLLIHAALIALRGVFASAMPFPSLVQGPAPAWIAIGIAALLAHYFCMAFLVMGMVKERLELHHRRAALADPLTGIANRRAFFERGERLLSRTVADGRPAALLVLDLDQFKRINDTFGHQAGDRVLCAFCDTVRVLLRPSDLFGRTGGEEFACLLPGAGEAEAIAIAERIRAAFESCRIGIGVEIPPSTVSVGVSTTAGTPCDLATLIAAADRALYRAKAGGRNRVERAPPRTAARSQSAHVAA